MYDDWAYRDTYQVSTQPESPRTTRARAHSLLQSVALDKNTRISDNGKSRSPPRAEVPRRRAHSLVNSPKNSDLADFTVTKPHILYPPSTKEKEAFFDQSSWLEDVDTSIDLDVLRAANDQKYQTFIDSATITAYACENLLKDSEKVTTFLNELSSSFDFVRKETNAFEEVSEALMSEQVRLGDLATQIEDHLKIFNSLDSATRILNAPGSDLVTRKNFKALLQDLDKGLEYSSEETYLKDIDLYAMRYRQCMTRAMSLIQDYICKRLRDLAGTVQKQMSVKGALNEDAKLSALAALLYAKFENESSRINELSEMISERSESNTEYRELYAQCLRTYLGIRYKLISPVILKDLDNVAKDPRDIVTVARTSLSFFRDTFSKERSLYTKFFGYGEFEQDAFQNWLIDLSEPLYDTLRQRIIRELDISRLCELTSVLLLFDNEEGSDASASELGPLFKPILYDVQSRLVFRVQTMVEQSIVRYNPTSDDLTTVSHRKKTAIKEVKASNFDAIDLLDGWYPPMKTAISLLSQIYQLVNSAIFDDLAHRIVHECIISLDKVEALAKARLGNMESWLFMIKNYLMMRAQITEFDIESIPAEVQVDFSGIQDVVSALRTEGLNSLNLLRLAQAGVPKVINNMFDAKEELYAKLKNSIHSFTEQAVQSIVGPLAKTDGELLRSAVADTREVRGLSTSQFPKIRKMIEAYIEDVRTIDILMDSIQDLVVQAYDNYYSRLTRLNPSSEQLDGIMDADGFSSWLGGIVMSLHHHTGEEDMSDDRSSL